MNDGRRTVCNQRLHVVEEVVVAQVEIVDEAGIGFVDVVVAAVEEFVEGWVLKRDQVVTEGDAVAGVVDEPLVGAAVEDELGPVQEVRTLVDWLVVDLFCFRWVVMGEMQPKLHL